eukprot:TRINITY_DN18365_c0_g1_i1.p1 TRINITY_DN18365_c0_g1~~TRINITY_DN18365_c0_g1_i1.p1  ORF type:complete len:230 (-),score=69.44 TRINITY_DN18365_c0_g1_i1:21-686(-)
MVGIAEKRSESSSSPASSIPSSKKTKRDDADDSSLPEQDQDDDTSNDNDGKDDDDGDDDDDKGDDDDVFVKGTVESEWGEDRKYIVRIKEEETDTEEEEGWPTILLPLRYFPHEDDESEEALSSTMYTCLILGGVWRKDTGELVAVWAHAEDGDWHIDFYGDEAYEHIDDLQDCTAHLCDDSEYLSSAFDDGSGRSRDVKKVTPGLIQACLPLWNMYTKNA